MKNVLEVHPATEIRTSLPAVLKRFRAEHAAAEPVIFGANRRPEAAIIPYELFQELVPFIEDIEIAHLVRERQAAGPAVPLEDVATQFGITLDPAEG